MSWLCALLTSSIGKKVQVAVAGLALCGFLVTHLLGNLLLLKGAETFNHYADVLRANPILPLAEIALIVIFVLHIFVALFVRWENVRARPIGYKTYKGSGGRTVGSATMAVSGTLLLAFIIVHVKTFRIADNGGDLFRHVMTKFQYAPYSVFYLAAMAALGLHLSHGFQSAFRTLGLEHPKYTPLITRAGTGFAAVMGLGFASLVAWAGWFAGGPR